jgi:hypothetical protein
MIEAIHHDLLGNIGTPTRQCFYKAELNSIVVLSITVDLLNQPIARVRLVAEPSSHH